MVELQSSGWSEVVMFPVRHRTVRFGVHPPTWAAKMKKPVGNAFWKYYGVYLQYIYIIISCTYQTPIPLSEPLSFRRAISESVKESFLNVFNTAQLSYQKSKHRGSHREAKMFHSTHGGQRNELRLSPGWNTNGRSSHGLPHPYPTKKRMICSYTGS